MSNRYHIIVYGAIYIYICVCITLYDMVCIWDRFVSESWMGGHIKNSFTGLGMAKCAWIAHLTLFHQVCKTIRNQATGSSNHKVWKNRNKGICLFCETSQFSYWATEVSLGGRTWWICRKVCKCQNAKDYMITSPKNWHVHKKGPF